MELCAWGRQTHGFRRGGHLGHIFLVWTNIELGHPQCVTLDIYMQNLPLSFRDIFMKFMLFKSFLRPISQKQTALLVAQCFCCLLSGSFSVVPWVCANKTDPLELFSRLYFEFVSGVSDGVMAFYKKYESVKCFWFLFGGNTVHCAKVEA